MASGRRLQPAAGLVEPSWPAYCGHNHTNTIGGSQRDTHLLSSLQRFGVTWSLVGLLFGMWLEECAKHQFVMRTPVLGFR